MHALYAAGVVTATSTPFDTATALWGLVGGILSPPLIAIFQQPHWTTRTRTLVSVGLSIAIAALTCALDGSLGHGQTLLATASTVLLGAQGTYATIWSKIGVTQAIEGATSSRPQPVDPPVDEPPGPRKRTPAKRSTAKSAAAKTTPRKR